MPMTQAALEQRLNAAFPDSEIVITDLAGDGDHYKARIVSPAFAGLPRVRQHQLVNKALATLKQESLTPQRTTQSLQENTAWLKQKIS